MRPIALRLHQFGSNAVRSIERGCTAVLRASPSWRELGAGPDDWRHFLWSVLTRRTACKPIASNVKVQFHLVFPLCADELKHGGACVIRKKACRETTKMNAEATVEEARMLAHRLVEYERGKCAGDVDIALYRASNLYGIEESALRSLRYRWRSLKFVKAHVFLRLKQIDEWFDERATQERKALKRTAEILEERGSRAAGIARIAAEMVGEEE